MADHSTALNLQPDLLQGNPPEILQQIYHLRVQAWKDLGVITPDKYPNGWFDELDPTALHWVIKDGDALVAAARLAIVDSFEQIPNGALLNLPGMPQARPIAHFSRRVVHPAYQKFGLGEVLLEVRLRYIKEAQISLAFTTAHGAQVEVFIRFGFIELGRVPKSIELVKNGDSRVLYYTPINI